MSDKKQGSKHPDVMCHVCGDFIKDANCNSLCKPDLGIHAVHAVFCMCRSCAGNLNRQEADCSINNDTMTESLYLIVANSEGS
jgi:hypothetical protein